MKFRKGQSGNPSGRPKGQKNRVTNDLRTRISLFLDQEFSTVTKAFKGLSAEKKVRLYVDLLVYAVPKLSNAKVEVEFEHLTDEQLQTIINELRKEGHDQKRND